MKTRTEITAEEAYESDLKMMLEVMHYSEDRQNAADKLLAENILERELGEYSNFQPEYMLDEVTRDRLIAHTRQDAANALIVALRLSDEMKALSGGMEVLAKLIWTTRAILIAFFIVFVFVILAPYLLAMLRV
jgi:hypothetical protein